MLIFVKGKEKFCYIRAPSYLCTLRRFIALKCYLCYPHTIREWRKEGFGFAREECGGGVQGERIVMGREGEKEGWLIRFVLS